MAGDTLTAEYFSNSRLDAFRHCRFRYRLRYLEREPEPARSIEATLGSCLHEVLEWLYNERRQNKQIIFDDLLHSFRNIWLAAIIEPVMVIPGRQTLDESYHLGGRMLAAFYRNYRPFDEPVVAIEEEIDFDLGGDANYPMKAILDRIDYDGKGQWLIHDYKSGRRQLTSFTAATDAQMRIYYLALLSTDRDIEDVQVVWHYLRHGTMLTYRASMWKPKSLESGLRRRIDSVREAVATPEKLQPNESVLCNWCYYWDTCPIKKGQQHPARLVQ